MHRTKVTEQERRGRRRIALCLALGYGLGWATGFESGYTSALGKVMPIITRLTAP